MIQNSTLLTTLTLTFFPFLIMMLDTSKRRITLLLIFQALINKLKHFNVVHLYVGAKSATWFPSSPANFLCYSTE